jgi:hypothetical protein
MIRRRNNNEELVQGLTFVQGLFLVFLFLKLDGSIDWSWLWVTSPLWVHFVFMALASWGTNH